MNNKKQQYRQIPGGVTAARGYKAAGTACGIKKQGLDLALIVSDHPAACAGTFTTNLVKAAPVYWTQRVAANGSARMVVVNSGNANACNGPAGDAAVVATAESAAALCGVPAHEVAVASTGVIGQPLNVDKLVAGIRQAAEALHGDGGAEAARAIMTTDTFPKEHAVELLLSQGKARIGGMAKGSGMIHPNMATMLSFITTDAAVPAASLRDMLQRAVAESFNMVTVDGDTSTNDMVFIMANGAAGVSLQTADDIAVFQAGLLAVCTELARMVARDGEGAGKLIEVTVKGAADTQAARTIARSIASSNLVKTAIHGEDANWGRIFCAAGYAGVDFDPAKVDIYLGDIQVAAGGVGMRFDEAAAKEVLRQSDVNITIDLNSGTAQAVAYTCDLTCDYIKINASYRS